MAVFRTATSYDATVTPAATRNTTRNLMMAGADHEARRPAVQLMRGRSTEGREIRGDVGARVLVGPAGADRLYRVGGRAVQHQPQ